MKHAELLKQLLPPVSYDPNGLCIGSELVVEGTVLDQVEEIARHISVTPINANGLILDWERLLALTPNTNDPYLLRVERVIAKLSEIGGLSISYFVRIAASIGYEIRIYEHESFKAGINSCGDSIYAEDVCYCWQVNVLKSSGVVYIFKAGSSCAAEPLQQTIDPIIETLFNDLKPAHTFCYFNYEVKK